MNRWKVLASTMALGLALTGGAWAQPQDWSHQDRRAVENNGRGYRGNGWQDDDRHRDHDRDDRNRDRDHDRDRDRDHDRDYRHGRYDRDDGYYRSGAYGRDGWYGRNGGYGRNGQGYYGNYGYGRSPAYQTGYRDGMFDGQNDSRTGHSFRPQQDDNYKHADRGYSSQFGDKNSYKQTYRGGYLEGYRAGFGR